MGHPVVPLQEQDGPVNRDNRFREEIKAIAKGRWRVSSRAALVAIVFTLLLLLFYRFRTWKLIGILYGDLGDLGFLSYLHLSLSQDAFLMLMTGIAMLLLFMVLPTRVATVAGSLLLASAGFLLVLGIDFFRLYETTLQAGYLGAEQATGISEMAGSFFAEMTLPLALTLLAWMLPALFVIPLALAFWGKKTGSHHLDKAGLLLIPLLALGFISFSGESAASRLASEFPSLEKKKVHSLLTEFARNPVTGLLLGEKPDSSLPEDMDIITELPPRFDTTTLTGDRTHIPESKLIPENHRYSIILYLFESTAFQYLDLKVNGRYVTPTLQRMSKNSLFFPNHYANYPLSANALFSLLTSTYEMSGRKMVIQDHPDIQRRTLSEILKKAGYRTMLIHTGTLRYAGQQRYLKDKGFDRIIQYNDLRRVPPYNRTVGWGMDERSMIRPVVEFMSEEPGKPVFIVVMPMNPHHPYLVPDEKFMIAGKVDPIDFNPYGKISEENRVESSIKNDEKDSPSDRVGESEEENKDRKSKRFSRNEVWTRYRNSLHFADHALGMMVSSLEKKGLMEDTLLFLVGDHGEAFYQHRMNFNHPFFIYEENVHVPCMIYNRDIFSSKNVYPGISRHIDIMPTILDILDMKLRARCEGVSLVSRHRPQLAVLHTSWKDEFLGIRDGRWKYILRLRDNFEELYDLGEDPKEKKNLAEQHPSLVSRFRSYLEEAHRYRISFYARYLEKSGEKKKQ
jgi:arylsulfatase A-like enzyme